MGAAGKVGLTVCPVVRCVVQMAMFSARPSPHQPLLGPIGMNLFFLLNCANIVIAFWYGVSRSCHGRVAVVSRSCHGRITVVVAFWYGV